MQTQFDHRDIKSQRALRAPQFVRYALAAAIVGVATLLQQTAATAEVCDKAVGENWRPWDGPVWLLNPVGFLIGLTALVGAVALVVVTRQRWLGYVASGLLALVIVGDLSDIISLHEVYRYELKEGCRSVPTDLFDIGLLTTFAVT